ncbi:MAG: hypothetical protein LBB89_00415 [Treponema sp.]|jgi:hypothetical protein|nr:hypothetical protein [Treponema sp.]
MTVFLVIIGVVIVLFFVVRPLLNKTVSQSSDKDWERILNTPEIDQMFRQTFQVNNIFHVIAILLKPLNINFTKFVSNIVWLANDGNEYTIKNSPDQSYYQFYTPSIKYFTRSINRPQMPIWYIAAFPDVNKWRNDDNTTEEDVENKLYVGITEDEVEEAINSNWESNNAINTLKKVVLNYKNNVKPYFEVQ